MHTALRLGVLSRWGWGSSRVEIHWIKFCKKWEILLKRKILKPIKALVWIIIEWCFHSEARSLLSKIWEPQIWALCQESTNCSLQFIFWQERWDVYIRVQRVYYSQRILVSVPRAPVLMGCENVTLSFICNGSATPKGTESLRLGDGNGLDGTSAPALWGVRKDGEGERERIKRVCSVI